MSGEAGLPIGREAGLARTIEEFRRQLEADPLLPSAEMCRLLDAIADDALELLGSDGADQPAR